MEHAVEHSADRGCVAEQFAPVFYRTFEVSNVLARCAAIIAGSPPLR